MLTEYFYNAFVSFEKAPQSFKESIGEMVYGMDVSGAIEPGEEYYLQPTSSSDVVHRSPRELRGLDLAEMKLIKGDPAGRAPWPNSRLQISPAIPREPTSSLPGWPSCSAMFPPPSTTLKRPSGFPRIRACCAGRTSTWDVFTTFEDQRDQAVGEYRAALTVRDGQADTRLAAEKGLKQPYAVPQQVHSEPAGDEDAGPADAHRPLINP